MSKPFYDVFISHAYEDQNEFVSQLAFELKREGLGVWYSGFELTLGGSVITCVSEALLKSRYGVVLISPVYLTKKRAMKELEALFGEEAEERRVLPVLHGVPAAAFRAKAPALSNCFCVSSRRGAGYVVKCILRLMNGEGTVQKTQGKVKKVARRKATAEMQKRYDSGVIVLGGGTQRVNVNQTFTQRRRTK